MENPLELLLSLLMEPCKVAIKALNLDIEPLLFAHILWMGTALTALVLRLPKLRRLSKLTGLIAILLALPGLLMSITMIIRRLL